MKGSEGTGGHCAASFLVSLRTPFRWQDHERYLEEVNTGCSLAEIADRHARIPSTFIFHRAMDCWKRVGREFGKRTFRFTSHDVRRACVSTQHMSSVSSHRCSMLHFRPIIAVLKSFQCSAYDRSQGPLANLRALT
jgi:hypothetical protein